MNNPLERQLKKGWYVYWRANIYQIVAYDLKGLVLDLTNLVTLENIQTALAGLLLDDAVCFAPTIEELHQEMRHQRPPACIDEASLPENLLAKAQQIIEIVEIVEQHITALQQTAALQNQPFRRTEALEIVLSQLSSPIALPTFYKYRKLYEVSQGNSRELAAGLKRVDYNQTRMSRAQLHFLDTVLQRYYSRRTQMRPQTIYRLAQSILAHTQQHWIDPDQCGGDIPANLVDELLDSRLPMSHILDNPEKAPLLTPIDLPSRSWFYGYLRWFEHQPEQGQHLIVQRYGQAAWDATHLVFDTFAAQAAFPLEYVFADHCLLDVFIVDDATRSQLNRLWLTLLIDAYSRSILGMALLYETPNIMSIQSALHQAIWPKTIHHQLGLAGEWTCYGIPQQLSLDNAWAHHSHSLEDLARIISRGGHYNSIDLVFRPPYRGRYGALIERFFGNLSAQMCEYLPGAIRSSHPQDLRAAVRTACLLYRDIERFIIQAILTYQHTVHGELQGMTPHEKWEEGLQFGLPLVPPYTPEMQRMFWRMSPHTRTITAKGISVFGMDYWSPELGQAERVNRQGVRVQYHFRYDPADISRLALFRDGQWMGDVYAKPLRQPDGSTRPLSMAERHLAQKLARQSETSSCNWLHYLQDIDEQTQLRQTEQRTVRKAKPVKPPLSDPQTIEAAIQSLDPQDIYANYTRLLTDFLRDEFPRETEE